VPTRNCSRLTVRKRLTALALLNASPQRHLLGHARARDQPHQVFVCLRPRIGSAEECGPSTARIGTKAGWCQNGTMKRMNLRDVPDDVYAVLIAAAEGSRQSLNAFVVDRLSEVAQAVRVADYVATYPAPRGTGVTSDDVVAAVRKGREAS